MHLSIGDKGPGVRRLQEMLDNLGFNGGSNDGIFGPSTRRAVMGLQQQTGLCQDGIVGEQTYRKITTMVEDERSIYSITPNGLHDITSLHEPPRNFAYLRSWQQIQGVTLHQTGCAMPARPLGWARVNAHYGVTREGLAILLNRPEDMIWHAQGASKTTIGVEIEGNYCGLEGNPRTLWAKGGGPHELNDAMLEALEVVFDDVLRRFGEAGERWSVIYGHRQSSRNRRGDPGGEIWRRVAIPWGEYLHTSSFLPSKVFGRGRPIPKQWDPNGKGAY